MHTLYLRTALFTLPQGGHVPVGAVILDGEILDRPAGCVAFKVATFRDDRGRALEGSGVELQIPWSKIDHIRVAEKA
ncbi:MAG: hypothetical protein R3F61_18315 [Myxococcota bacterium]